MIPKMTRGLSLEARFIYGILITRANGDNDPFPGQKYLANEIGCGVRSVQRYIDELKKAGYIEVVRMGLRKTNRYKLKRVDESLTGQNGVSRCDTAVVSRHDTAVASHSIRRDVKEEMNKILAAETAAVDTKDIIKVFDSFREINPTINYGNKTQRKAASELIEKFGVDKIIGAVAFIAENVQDRYCPVVTTPYQLKEKLAALVQYKNKKDSAKPMMLTI